MNAAQRSDLASGRYFNTARREILPWLQRDVRRLLDVGCGRGATVALVRGMRVVEWAGGVEFEPAEAEAARGVCDRVWAGDVAAADLESEIAPASLDLVLCLDVLEHLVDPWTTVARLSPLIAPGGRLLISVPNVRNWKFIWRLLARGDFRYREAGLLDRTHLRFFTFETAAELAAAGGLEVQHVGPAQPWVAGDVRAILSTLSGHRLDPLLAKQILIVASPRDTRPGAQALTAT